VSSLREKKPKEIKKVEGRGQMTGRDRSQKSEDGKAEG
jgi:hypothetical protein